MDDRRLERPTGRVPTACGARRYRVLVLTDHVMFGEALDLALTRQGYDSRAGLLTRAASEPRAPGRRSAPFDAALVDAHPQHGAEPLALVAALARSGTSVVVVSSLERDRWGAYLHAGARVVIGAQVGLVEVLATFRRLGDGLAVQTADERRSLLRAWSDLGLAHVENHRRLLTLTLREGQVLGELMHGHAVAEIARVSFVSQATVRTQVKSILFKLDVPSQVAAVGLAHRMSWRGPPPTPPPTPPPASVG